MKMTLGRFKIQINFLRFNRLPFVVFFAMFFALLFSAQLISCTKKNETNPVNTESSASLTEAELFEKGKKIYVQNCISCHNSDPKKPGSVGPEVFGSSEELLIARLSSAKYPPDYKPKKQSHLMPSLPALAKEAKSLSVYLNK